MRGFNMKKTFLAIGFFLGASACSGLLVVPQPQIPCKTDADCPVSYRCLKGVCTPPVPQPTCTNCDVDQTCDAKGNCITPPPDQKCSAKNLTGLCPVGETCVAGNCVPITQPCSTNYPQGECAVGCCDNGVCVDCGLLNPCSPTDPTGYCPVGEACSAGICVDVACDAEHPLGSCPQDYVCENGVCVWLPCSLAHPKGACDNGYSCSGCGLCIELGTCCDAADCALHYTCSNERCIRDCTCSTSSDCFANEHCASSTCLPKGMCAAAGECSYGPAGAGNNNCSDTPGTPVCSCSGACSSGACTANSGVCIAAGTCATDCDCAGTPSTPQCSPSGLVCVANGACCQDSDCKPGRSCLGASCLSSPITGGTCTPTATPCNHNGAYATCPVSCAAFTKAADCTSPGCTWNGTNSTCAQADPNNCAAKAQGACSGSCTWNPKANSGAGACQPTECCAVGERCDLTGDVCIMNGQCVTNADCDVPYFTCDTTSQTSTMYTCVPDTTDYNCTSCGASNCSSYTSQATCPSPGCAWSGSACQPTKCSNGGACIPSTTSPTSCAVNADCASSVEVCNPLWQCEVNAACGVQKPIAATKIEPNMVIVQDISGSMSSHIPTSDPCASNTSQTACQNMSGCIWQTSQNDYMCTGCGNYSTSQTACNAVAGCLWAQCTGGGNCLALPDQATCQVVSGCTWNPSGATCQDPTRFQTGLYAIDSIVESYSVNAPNILFGLSRFADPNNHDGHGSCSAGYQDAQTAVGNGATIESLLSGTTPSSNTPTAQTFQAVVSNPSAYGLPAPNDTTPRPNYVLLCTDGQANCSSVYNDGDNDNYEYRNVNALLDKMRAGVPRTPDCSTHPDQTSCIAAACDWNCPCATNPAACSPACVTPACTTPTIKTFVVGFQFDVYPYQLNSAAVHGGTARTDNDCPHFYDANCPTYTTQSACQAVSGNLCAWEACAYFNGSSLACQAIAGCTWNNGTCSGAAGVGRCDYNVDVTCAGMTQSNCTTQPICTLTGTNCSSNTTQPNCQAAGCAWITCNAFNGNQSACTTGTTGCTWSACAGLTRTLCRSANSGCTWNGSACSGSGGVCQGSTGGICQNQCGYRFCYYPATSPTELLTAFQNISGSIASCSFQLTEVPPNPQALGVYWDDGHGNPSSQAIPADPVNGWQYVTNTNTMNFYGTSCAMIKSGSTPDIVPGCCVGEGCN
jgi:hypothetical protein